MVKKSKKALQIFILALTFGIIFLLQLKGNLEKKRFFKSKLNTVIVEIKNNSTFGRSFDYVTKDKTIITFINSGDVNLKLKDSIIKESNSWEFIVFRMDEFGYDYKFYNKYDYQ